METVNNIASVLTIMSCVLKAPSRVANLWQLKKEIDRFSKRVPQYRDQIQILQALIQEFESHIGSTSHSSYSENEALLIQCRIALQEASEYVDNADAITNWTISTQDISCLLRLLWHEDATKMESQLNLHIQYLSVAGLLHI